MVELRLLRTVEHQANAAAVEKRQARRRFEQQFQSEDFLVELRRALHIAGSNLDLSQPCNAGSAGAGSVMGLISIPILVSIANYI